MATSALGLASVVSLAVAGTTLHNRRLQRNLEVDEGSRDTTRPQNLRFGLNWGAGADLMVMEELDTGDLLFGNVDCSKEVEFGSFVQCHLKQTFGMAKFDDVGVAVRTPSDVKVILFKFGKAQVWDYPDLVCRIWNKRLILRKMAAPALPEDQALAFTQNLQRKATDLVEKFSEGVPKRISEQDFLSLLGSSLDLFETSKVPKSIDELIHQSKGAPGVVWNRDIVIRTP